MGPPEDSQVVKCFFASDRSVPALSGGLDVGYVVVVGAYLGLGTV